MRSISWLVIIVLIMLQSTCLYAQSSVTMTDNSIDFLSFDENNDVASTNQLQVVDGSLEIDGMDVVTAINDLFNRVDILETEKSDLMNRVDVLETEKSDLMNRVDVLEAENIEQDQRISELEDELSGGSSTDDTAISNPNNAWLLLNVIYEMITPIFVSPSENSLVICEYNTKVNYTIYSDLMICTYVFVANDYHGNLIHNYELLEGSNNLFVDSSVDIELNSTNGEFQLRFTDADYLNNNNWLFQTLGRDAGPSKNYLNLEFKGKFGVIAPYSKDFCKSCNRLRITAKGDLRLCLFGNTGINIRHLMQKDEQLEELKDLILKQLNFKKESHYLELGETGLMKNLSTTGG